MQSPGAFPVGIDLFCQQHVRHQPVPMQESSCLIQGVFPNRHPPLWGAWGLEKGAWQRRASPGKQLMPEHPFGASQGLGSRWELLVVLALSPARGGLCLQVCSPAAQLILLWAGLFGLFFPSAVGLELPSSPWQILEGVFPLPAPRLTLKCLDLLFLSSSSCVCHQLI